MRQYPLKSISERESRCKAANKTHINKKYNHLNKIKVSLDSFSSKYKNFLLMGDFNSEPIEETISDLSPRACML